MTSIKFPNNYPEFQRKAVEIVRLFIEAGIKNNDESAIRFAEQRASAYSDLFNSVSFDNKEFQVLYCQDLKVSFVGCYYVSNTGIMKLFST